MHTSLPYVARGGARLVRALLAERYTRANIQLKRDGKFVAAGGVWLKIVPFKHGMVIPGETISMSASICKL